MIYWLIPYLVAYNASNAGNWIYGPEHVFKAEVRTIATSDELSTMHLSSDMYLACRPMNSSVIQCRVASATIDNWSTEFDGTSSSEFHSPLPMRITDAVFHVAFNEDGVSKLWLTEPIERFKLDMLRAIFDTVHWGIDLSGQRYGRYDRVEKSMIGSCETTFDIGRRTPTKEEKNSRKAIYGYSFAVPTFEGRTENKPFVIEKNRHVDRCSDQKLYLFESSDDKEFNEKHGLTKKTQVTSSRNRIYVGINRFSSYTRNIGTLEITGSRATSMRTFLNIDGFVHLSLETIRPAKEDIRQTEDSASAEGSFETGTAKPSEGAPAVTSFM